MWKRALFLVAVCGFAVGMATAEPAQAVIRHGTQIEYATSGPNPNVMAVDESVLIPLSIALLGLT